MGGTLTATSSNYATSPPSSCSCSGDDVISMTSFVSRLKHAVISGDIETVLSLNYHERRCDCTDVTLADLVIDRIRNETALVTAVRLSQYHLVPILLTSSVGDSSAARHHLSYQSRYSAARTAVRLLLRELLIQSRDKSEGDNNYDVTRTVAAGIVAIEQHRRRGDNDHDTNNCFRLIDEEDGVSTSRCDVILRRDDRAELVICHRTHRYNRTIMTSGFTRSQYECLCYLLRHLVNENVKPDDGPFNSNGDTAIILAVRTKMYSLIPDLLAAGFDVGRSNNRGRTALDELIEALFPVSALAMESAEVNNNYGRRYAIDTRIRQLRQEPCRGVVDDWSPERLPAAMMTLIEAGAARSSLFLGWFLLHCVHDMYLVRQLILNCFPAEDFPASPTAGPCTAGWRVTDNQRQLFRLLLQTSVKFNQADNAELLLRRVALPISEAPVTFWMSESLASKTRRLLPGHSAVTWSTVSRLANSGRIGVVADRIIDALPLPVSGALILIRAGGQPEIIRRVVLELLRVVRVDDIYETGNAVEMFYQYSMMSHPVDDRRRLLRLLAATRPRLSASVVQMIATRYSIDPAEYWQQFQRPRHLKDLSRCCIRSNMQTNVYHAVERLPLPRVLKDYIIRIKEDDHDCHSGIAHPRSVYPGFLVT